MTGHGRVEPKRFGEVRRSTYRTFNALPFRSHPQPRRNVTPRGAHTNAVTGVRLRRTVSRSAADLDYEAPRTYRYGVTPHPAPTVSAPARILIVDDEPA